MKISLEGARKILHTGIAPRVVSKDEQEYLIECLKLHPSYKEKVGTGVKQIWIHPSMYGTRGFFVERENGSYVDFSILKCFHKSLRTSGAKFRVAARFAANVTRKKGLTMHHEPPWTFEAIVKEFLRECAMDPADIEYDGTGLGTQFVDLELRQRFKTFHDARAVIRPLTRKEHYVAHHTRT